ncbi:DUF5335 domain-containing protein [Duganella sp. Dugasp56]|uniref:DUF5335 domain-containing protein n=1 Tax=Duganella sp. Dugasp56 TaxID=3243046 RepID=UPI0039AF72CF
MTTTSKLEKAAWKPYFDHVSTLLEGMNVGIEVASLQIGSQFAAEWLPLTGVVYDPKDDLIAIMAEGLDHMIRRPREVFIETKGVNLLSMEVVDADGVSQVIRFREPLKLPAP